MRLEFQGGSRGSGLRSSLHYASTPTLNSAGNSSVDENASTGSSDYWENSSSNDQSDIVYTQGRIYISNKNRSTRRRTLKSKRSESPETSSSSSGKFETDVRVTAQDLNAVDACLRGHRTRVFVCHSMANLYTCPRASTASPAIDTSTSWTLAYTGIPALLLDSGNTKSRTKRQIQLVLVEKGSSFILWSDIIDNLTKYTRQSSAFHTMHLSADHSRRIGLSFDDGLAADNFYQHLLRLTSDPANIALSGPRASSKKSGGQSSSQENDTRHKKYRPPNKSEISQPCAFQHVVSVTRNDFAKYFSLQAYVKAGIAASPEPTNVTYKRGTSVRSIPKQPPPPPPPPPKRNTSLSCSDLTA